MTIPSAQPVPAQGRPSRDAVGPASVVALSVGLWAVVLLGPATTQLASKGVYAAVHVLLELPSIALSCAIFLFASNIRSRDAAGWIPWAGAASLAMALIDVSHVLAYPGMPGLFGPPVFQSTIVLWLSARFVLFFLLLGLAAQSSLTRAARRPLRPVLAISFGVSVWLVVIGTLHLWPALHRAGQGLTAYKVGAEFFLVVVGAVAGLVFLRRARRTEGDERRQLQWLVAACTAHSLAELAFTRYVSATDLANFVGHLLKAAGDLAVFQALFVAAVRLPYVRLDALRAQKSTLVEAMPDPWLVVDEAGVVLEQRRATPRPFGAEQDLAGAALDTILTPDAHTELAGMLKAALGAGDAREQVFVAPGPSLPGSFNVTAVALPRTALGAHTALLLVRDISARQAAEAQLRIAGIAFEAPVALVVLGADGVVAQVNRAFLNLTGWTRAGVRGRPLGALAATPDEAARWQARLEQPRPPAPAQAPVLVRRIDGDPFHAEQSLAAVHAADGAVTHLVMALRDLTAERSAAQAIHRLAYYDSLTGLPNRRLLIEQITAALAQAREVGVLGAVLFLDLDHFKTLNDTRGHDVGDRLLRAVAERLTEQITDQDLVARLGGDEFVVLLRQLHPDETQSAACARRTANALQATLRVPFALQLSTDQDADTLVHHTSPSIGICLFGRGETDTEELLKRADLAMYQAKDAGRDTVRFFDPALEAQLVQRVALAQHLRAARSRDELWIAWQPQVDQDGSPIGAEALLRWTHAAQGTIGPARFIPIAEDTGLIVELGLWVLQSACECLARWAKSPRTRALRLSVNVSARQLFEPDFAEQVGQLLASSGAPADHLVLELTESMVLEGADQSRDRLDDLAALGVRLSMDDFGTGYSSLALLKRLPLAEVKIDRGFVKGLPADVDDAAIVRAILGICHGLRLQVVAEGVETDAQRAFLVEAGCEAFQGFRYARPMPLDALEAWLEGPRGAALGQPESPR